MLPRLSCIGVPVPGGRLLRRGAGVPGRLQVPPAGCPPPAQTRQETERAGREKVGQIRRSTYNTRSVGDSSTFYLH